MRFAGFGGWSPMSVTRTWRFAGFGCSGIERATVTAVCQAPDITVATVRLERRRIGVAHVVNHAAKERRRADLEAEPLLS